MKFTAILIVALVILLQLGCASFASNPAACRMTPSATYPLPFAYQISGNLFQLSPCTSIEPLRVEIGWELDHIRDRVIEDLDDSQKKAAVKVFAMRMGCDETGYDEFYNELEKNRYDIFGKEMPVSNKNSVAIVRKITKSNPILKVACWR